jgi:hypothetical protein
MSPRVCPLFSCLCPSFVNPHLGTLNQRKQLVQPVARKSDLLHCRLHTLEALRRAAAAARVERLDWISRHRPGVEGLERGSSECWLRRPCPPHMPAIPSLEHPRTIFHVRHPSFRMLSIKSSISGTSLSRTLGPSSTPAMGAFDQQLIKLISCTFGANNRKNSIGAHVRRAPPRCADGLSVHFMPRAHPLISVRAY